MPAPIANQPAAAHDLDDNDAVVTSGRGVQAGDGN